MIFNNVLQKIHEHKHSKNQLGFNTSGYKDGHFIGPVFGASYGTTLCGEQIDPLIVFKRRCYLTIIAILWPIALIIGILFAVLCFTQQVGYSAFDNETNASSNTPNFRNQQLENFTLMQQFPYQIFIPYKNFGLTSDQFYPALTNYTFYTCQNTSSLQYIQKQIAYNKPFYMLNITAIQSALTIFTNYGAVYVYPDDDKVFLFNCLLTNCTPDYQHKIFVNLSYMTNITYYLIDTSCNQQYCQCQQITTPGFQDGIIVGVPYNPKFVEYSQTFDIYLVIIQSTTAFTVLSVIFFFLFAVGVAIQLYYLNFGCLICPVFFPCCVSKSYKHNARKVYKKQIPIVPVVVSAQIELDVTKLDIAIKTDTLKTENTETTRSQSESMSASAVQPTILQTGTQQQEQTQEFKPQDSSDSTPQDNNQVQNSKTVMSPNIQDVKMISSNIEKSIQEQTKPLDTDIETDKFKKEAAPHRLKPISEFQQSKDNAKEQ